MVRWFACALVSMGLAACGGDFCDADVATLAGTWEVSFDTGSDTDSGTLVIDDNGNVTLVTSESDAWDCSLVNDELCALKVSCKQKGGTNDFTLSITKKD